MRTYVRSRPSILPLPPSPSRQAIDDVVEYVTSAGQELRHVEALNLWLWQFWKPWLSLEIKFLPFFWQGEYDFFFIGDLGRFELSYLKTFLEDLWSCWNVNMLLLPTNKDPWRRNVRRCHQYLTNSNREGVAIKKDDFFTAKLQWFQCRK